MFNKKNDPLVNSIKSIMIQTDKRKQLEERLNMDLGITSRKAIPNENVEEYDSILDKMIHENDAAHAQFRARSPQFLAPKAPAPQTSVVPGVAASIPVGQTEKFPRIAQSGPTVPTATPVPTPGIVSRAAKAIGPIGRAIGTAATGAVGAMDLIPSTMAKPINDTAKNLGLDKILNVPGTGGESIKNHPGVPPRSGVERDTTTADVTPPTPAPVPVRAGINNVPVPRVASPTSATTPIGTVQNQQRTFATPALTAPGPAVSIPPPLPVATPSPTTTSIGTASNKPLPMVPGIAVAPATVKQVDREPTPVAQTTAKDTEPASPTPAPKESSKEKKSFRDIRSSSSPEWTSNIGKGGAIQNTTKEFGSDRGA